ncbi:MAG: hypothetical protein ACTSP4_14845 [Candidatus Hodarchaeales archaeon]
MTNLFIILVMAAVINMTIRLIIPSSMIPALLVSFVFIAIFLPRKDSPVKNDAPLTVRAIIEDLEHLKENPPPEISDYTSLASIFDTMSRSAAEEQVTVPSMSMTPRGNTCQNVAGPSRGIIRVLPDLDDSTGISASFSGRDVIVLPEPDKIAGSPVEDTTIHEFEKFIIENSLVDDGEPVRVIDVFSTNKREEKNKQKEEHE